MNMVEDFPSKAAWGVIIPMLKPAFGNTVRYLKCQQRCFVMRSVVALLHRDEK